ncbi:hypothetical protein JXM67_07605 [candidate division WOR-3 bacterium]|nr:hypothetical protein [candidate division WOR-3 bacterium]
MRNIKKLILGFLTLLILLGASPALAQLAGTWEGAGTGNCPNPFPTPPESMCPWHRWTGEISDEENAFKGEWRDYIGFRGTFRGRLILSTPEYAVCRGEWTAIDDSVDPPIVLVMGVFQMNFYYESETCRGKWWLYDSDQFHGTMEGRKID